MKSLKCFLRYEIGLIIFILAISANYGIGAESQSGVVIAKITRDTVVPEEVVLERTNQQVQTAVAVQNRHTPGFMSLPGVVGTATGLTEDGRAAILVFTKTAAGKGVIPDSLEGVPVVTMVSGAIFAMEKPAAKPSPVRVDPTGYFKRPVPIGVSTGSVNECSSGTIGARVKDSSDNVYALSNNHVYALENTAALGIAVLQPGRYDTNCIASYSDQQIGALSSYESIIFSTSASNTIDAAIAFSSLSNLGNSTPSNGYGTPRSATVSGGLGLAVQKYGRTTSLTRGTITGINATVDVSYSSGVARFVDQIIVYSNKPFIQAGDSGSLLVTEPGKNPVGLLFAGSSSGKYAVANQIDLVLSRFGVTIDGE